MFKMWRDGGCTDHHEPNGKVIEFDSIINAFVSHDFFSNFRQSVVWKEIKRLVLVGVLNNNQSFISVNHFLNAENEQYHIL